MPGKNKKYYILKWTLSEFEGETQTRCNSPATADALANDLKRLNPRSLYIQRVEYIYPTGQVVRQKRLI